MIGRFLIHFTASAALVLAAYFGLRFAERRSDWFRQNWKLAFAGMIVFGFASLREAVDVYNGQPLLKAFTDYASWLAGSAASAYGLYRFQR